MAESLVLKGCDLTVEKIKEACGNKTKRVNIRMRDDYGKEYGIWAFLRVNKKGNIRCKMMGLDWFDFKISEKTEAITFYYNGKKK
ncbi:MAG TPA: hypothetical protein PLB52_00610 [Candidatus Moranbacteria bacterium]|nr:hypothetical protein [Candidatus Moranbacteria bacterium]